MNEVEAQTLVCVFLRGGADTLNLLVPYGDDRYYALRPTLSIPPPAKGKESSDASIRLDDFYAFHPKLSPLVPLFKEGRLAVVQGVGSDNTSGSHFEAQDQMEQGEGFGQTVGGGWLGRHLRIRRAAESTPLSAVAIGPTIPGSLRGAPAVSTFHTIDEIQIQAPAGGSQAISNALGVLYGAEKNALSRAGRTTLDLLKRVESLRTVGYIPAGEYPKGEFGAGLREIARLIKARVGVEAAAIDLGGWDTHFFQGTTTGLQAEAIDQLGRGLAAFDADLGSCRECVTTLVMTEFGRRIYENSSLGTDHGRGFAMIAIGSRIHGAKVYGRWPGLEEEQHDLLGPAGLKINFDYRSVLTEVLAGVFENQKADQVFPGFHPQPIGLVRGLAATAPVNL